MKVVLDLSRRLLRDGKISQEEFDRLGRPRRPGYRLAGRPVS